MYRRKKSRRKDLPLRKAPATETTTTCLSLTWSCMRMSSSAASSSSNEWSSLARTTWMALPPPLLLTATSSSMFPAKQSTHNQHADFDTAASYVRLTESAAYSIAQREKKKVRSGGPQSVTSLSRCHIKLRIDFFGLIYLMKPHARVLCKWCDYSSGAVVSFSLSLSVQQHLHSDASLATCQWFVEPFQIQTSNINLLYYAWAK